MPALTGLEEDEEVQLKWALSVKCEGNGNSAAGGYVEDFMDARGDKTFNPDSPEHNYKGECDVKECKTSGELAKCCGHGKDVKDRMKDGKWICARDCFAYNIEECGRIIQVVEDGKLTKGQKWETKAANKAGLIPEDFDAKASLKTRSNYASKGKHPTFVRIFVPKPADSDNFAGEIKGALRGLKLIK